MARPLAVIGFACFGAWFASALIGFNAIVVLAALCFLLFLLALFCSPLRRWPAISTVFVVLALSFGWSALAEVLYYQPLARYDGQTVHALVQVVSVDGENDGRYVVETVQGELPAGVQMLLYVDDPEFVVELYDGVDAAFALRARSSDWTQNYVTRCEGSLFVANFVDDDGTAEYTVIEPTRLSAYAQLQLVRRQAMQTFHARLPGDTGGLLCAIVFGDKRFLSETAILNFRLSGISHLIAVSGLHMTIISQGFLGFLRKLRLPRRLSAVLTAGVVLGFMALTGFTPSVSRAGVMCLVLLAGQMVRREPDSLNSLGFALLLILAADPYAVLDVGLWLSFAATVGLLFLLPWFQKHAIRPLERKAAPGRRRILFRWLCLKPLSALFVTLSAVAFTLPISMVVFGEFSLVSPLTNLMTVFPASLLLGLASLGAICSFVPVLDFLCRGLLMVAGLLARYLLAISAWFASLPFACADVGEPYLAAALIAGFVLCWLGWRCARGRGVNCAAALSVIILMWGMLTHTALMNGVTCIEVAGRENAATLVEQDERSLLILSGDRPDTAPIEATLQKYGIERVDILVLTETGKYGADALDKVLRYAAVGHVAFPAETGETTFLASRVGEMAMPLDGRSISFWTDGRLQSSGDWIRLTVGETRLLICPAAGDAAELPEAFCQNHLTVYTGAAPKNAERLTTQVGVLTCSAYRLDEAIKSLPHGGGERRMTAIEEVALFSRGRGDLTRRI